MKNRNQINSILYIMDDLQEKIFDLSDDMLLSIDPRDNYSLEEGMRFIQGYNTNLSQFYPT